ncbi:MAG: ImmA/IrrE family metallo-endopeptidase [Parvibaculaceae bacterium]
MRALEEAGALGVLPTPIDQIMEVARVQEVHEDVLNADFLSKLRAEVGKTGAALKRALGKVLGLFDARASLVFVDRSLLEVKQRFVRLHEAAHGFLPWQRPMYSVVEDCKEALEPDVAEDFDREANVFASEVMFQGDSFIEEANSSEFSVNTPLRLKDKYGASIYASIRQYVSKNHRICAVVVLDPPELVRGDGFVAHLRRAVQSQRFNEMFGVGNWPEQFTPDDQIGALVPLWPRRASRPRQIRLTDLNGDQHEFVAEAFTQKYQVFVLVHHVNTLSATTIVLP